MNSGHERHRDQLAAAVRRLRKRYDRAEKAGNTEMHLSMPDAFLLISLSELALQVAGAIAREEES